MLKIKQSLLLMENEDYFLHQEEKTFQGSVPQKADEIMLPQNYLDFLGKSYQTGDTISIDLTGTGQKAEYTLSGVLNNTKESNGYFIYVSKELAQDLAKRFFSGYSIYAVEYRRHKFHGYS